jgi:hypothetical protein
MRMVRAMAEQAIEGDPKGEALDVRTYMNQRRALHGESVLEGLPDEEQPGVGRMGCQLPRCGCQLAEGPRQARVQRKAARRRCPVWVEVA